MPKGTKSRSDGDEEERTNRKKSGYRNDTYRSSFRLIRFVLASIVIIWVVTTMFIHTSKLRVLKDEIEDALHELDTLKNSNNSLSQGEELYSFEIPQSSVRLSQSVYYLGESSVTHNGVPLTGFLITHSSDDIPEATLSQKNDTEDNSTLEGDTTNKRSTNQARSTSNEKKLPWDTPEAERIRNRFFTSVRPSRTSPVSSSSKQQQQRSAPERKVSGQKTKNTNPSKSSSSRKPYTGSSNKPKPRVSDSLSNCYKIYGSGARWKSSEPLYIRTTNTLGLSSDYVFNVVQLSANTWISQISQFSGNGFSPISSFNLGGVDGADYNSPDGKNEWTFGTIQTAGVLAVTIVWGVFDGPVSGQGIFEADMVFSQDYTWGNASKYSGVMDTQNVCTHEFGHYFGEMDLYTSDCADATMDGYSDINETKKRTLSSGDLVGMCLLYSPSPNSCISSSGSGGSVGGAGGGSSGGGSIPNSECSYLLPDYQNLYLLTLLVLVVSNSFLFVK